MFGWPWAVAQAIDPPAAAPIKRQTMGNLICERDI